MNDGHGHEKRATSYYKNRHKKSIDPDEYICIMYLCMYLIKVFSSGGNRKRNETDYYSKWLPVDSNLSMER